MTLRPMAVEVPELDEGHIRDGLEVLAAVVHKAARETSARERASEIERKRERGGERHTHIHTHRKRERERERETHTHRERETHSE